MTSLLIGVVIGISMMIPPMIFCYLECIDTKDDLNRLKKRHYRMLLVYSRHRD